MDDQSEMFAPLSDGELSAGRGETTQARRAREAKAICPPADAGHGSDAAGRLFGRAPDHLWRYAMQNGTTAFYVCRWDFPDGKKAFRPLSYIEDKGWAFEAWPGQRPLYRLDEITAKPNAPIVVCEGEKAADAAARIFPQSIVTTSSGGANAAAKSDWAPLAGRRVLIWPDNDEAGAKYAREIAAILAALDCDVLIINAKALAAVNPAGGEREAAEKFDAADAVAEWVDLRALRKAAVKFAKEFDTSIMRRPDPLPLAPPLPAARPYPVAALGSILGDAASSIASKTQCAPALAAQSVLAVASLAAQRLADVRLPYGQTRPLSLFFVTIAASGDRKSTADNEALVPVRKRESNLKCDYEIQHESWRISDAAWAAQHRKIENDKGLDRLAREAELSALGRAPIEPIKPLLTAPEPTVEALAKHWHALPGALGLFSAEGGQMTGGHGFGPDHRLKTAATLSALWDGSGIRRLRAGDGITDLPGRRLSLHLMVQPDAAAAFLSEPVLRDQGLLSRLLIAAPESLAGTRLWNELMEDVGSAMDRYNAAVVDLLERPAPTANQAGNELMPRVLDMSVEARDVWIGFHDAVETGMSADGPLEGLRDVAGKAAENAARIAGVLTIIETPDASTIEAETLAAACELMSWYLNEELRLTGLHRLPEALRNANTLLEWIRAKGKVEITLRDVMRTGPNRIRTKAEAEAALAKLEDHGWLVRQGQGKGAKWVLVKGAPQ
jgi:hypothetical protein